MASKYIKFHDNDGIESVLDDQQLDFKEKFALQNVFTMNDNGMDKIAISVVDSGVGIT